MTENKSWVCPCNGCKKARRQAFQEIEDALNKWGDDINLSWFEVSTKVREELHPKKEKKKSDDKN